MKAVIFDLDGTVFDSMPLWSRLAVDMLESHNIEFPENILEILTPMGLSQGADYVLSLGLPLSKEEILKSEIEYAAEHYAKTIPAKPGAVEYMQKLEKRGIKMFSFTAGMPELFMPCAQRLGITGYIKEFYTADMFALPKSDPKAWGILAEKIGENPEEITVFDDNLENLTAAKEAGMRVIGVYDLSAKHNSEQIRRLAHGYISDFTEL